MMTSAVLGEQAALDALEPRLRKNGYTLIREPASDQLPPFLKGFHPDAIAIGATPSLVIEVLRSRTGATATKVQQIISLLRGHGDWQLEVVYVSPEGSPVEPVPSSDIRATIQRVRRMVDTEPQASLLLAWSALEAIGRNLEPELTAGSLTPNSLIDVLISNGHASQAEGILLRQLGKLRNAIAHGQINLSPESNDLAALLQLEERLAA